MNECPNCGVPRDTHALTCSLCGYKPRLSPESGRYSGLQSPPISEWSKELNDPRQPLPQTPPTEESMREVLAEAKKRKGLRSRIKNKGKR